MSLMSVSPKTKYIAPQRTQTSPRTNDMTPCGIAVLNTGDVVVAELLNNRLQIYTSQGTPIKTIGKQGSGPGDFWRPTDVVINSQQQFIVADSFNHRVQVLTKDGEFVREMNDDDLGFPLGVCLDDKGHIYSSQRNPQKITVFNKDGRKLRDITSDKFKYLRHIRHFNQHLYVADSEANVIHILTNKGDYVKSAGDGQLKGPRGVAVDRVGNILVAEWHGRRITVIEPDGKITTRLGEGELGKLEGLTVNMADEIVACDFSNNKIFFM